MPTLLYGCELWNNLKQTDLEVVNKFQQFVMKCIQRLKKATRTDMRESIFGVYPLSQNCLERYVAY